MDIFNSISNSGKVEEKKADNSLSLPAEKRYLQVKDLLQQVNQTLVNDYDMIAVEAEISKISEYPNAYYIDLKDVSNNADPKTPQSKSKTQNNAQILKAFAFKFKLKIDTKQIQNGSHVLVLGSLGVSPVNGSLQLTVSKIQLINDSGLNALRIEQLKKKIQSLGLDALERKRQIPEYVQRVGIVTSNNESSAALKDMLRVFSDKGRDIHIIVYPALVQGANAAKDLKRAIALANQHNICDVLIVGRGGGSDEDLNCFNEEEVIFALAESKIPTISAIGHQINFSLSDMVSDLHLPTPTAAAEFLVKSRIALRETIDSSISKMLQLSFAKINTNLDNIKSLHKYLTYNSPQKKYLLLNNELLELKHSLKNSFMLTHKAILDKVSNFDISYLNLKNAIKHNLEGKMNNNLLLNNLFAAVLDKHKNQIGYLTKETQQTNKELNNLIKVYLNSSKEKYNLIEQNLHNNNPMFSLAKGFSFISNKQGKNVKSALDINLDEVINIEITDAKVLAKIIKIIKKI